MKFPETRLRRLRSNAAIRNMVRETTLTRNDLIMPLFVCPGQGVDNPISSMPGNSQLSVDKIVEKGKELFGKGVQSVLLFGIPESKDEHGLVACTHNGIVQRAVQALKKEVPELYLIADICNCEYTTHGHCGTIVDGDVHNDLTLVTLAKQSVSLAESGVDMVAPSDMMDGRVGAIRSALDKKDFYNVPIMAYSAKYSSAFYGPFREAVESAPQFGDRKTYQMDPANGDEALREVALDIQEGADIVMVKPGMPYLDVVRAVSDRFNVPVSVYNVSGEYAMIKAAAAKGWLNEEEAMMESLIAFKRAGASLIATYFAKEAAKLITKKA